MIRILALALLLANLLYLGWAEWIAVPPPAPASSIAGLPRLTLVSELPAAKRAALAKGIPPQTPPPVCVAVGPFDDPGVASKAAALLQAKGFAPRQRIAQAPAIRRFWVYLDGFASNAAVTGALHRLEHGGIDDAEAMPPQAGRRTISLGLYSDRERADQRAKAVRAMGLKPKVSERMVPGTVSWLEVTLPNSSASVPLKDVSDLEPGGGSSSPPISVRPCPTSTAPTTSSASPHPAGAAAKAGSPALQLPAAGLPRCKPGGGGPVPCIESGARAATHPAVL